MAEISRFCTGASQETHSSNLPPDTAVGLGWRFWGGCLTTCKTWSSCTVLGGFLRLTVGLEDGSVNNVSVVQAKGLSFSSEAMEKLKVVMCADTVVLQWRQEDP